MLRGFLENWNSVLSLWNLGLQGMRAKDKAKQVSVGVSVSSKDMCVGSSRYPKAPGMAVMLRRSKKAETKKPGKKTLQMQKKKIQQFMTVIG